MIKPAAAGSKNHHITLLATRATAYSTRTESLIKRYAAGVTLDRPTDVTDGSDAIIIGCTHYIALIQRLEELFPGITIYEPTKAIATRIESLIAH